MGSQTSEAGLVSTRYAATLVDMAVEAKNLDKVEKDMADLAGMVAESSALQVLIRNPLMDRLAQKDAILALAQKAKFQTLTARFLAVLAENRRLGLLMPIIKAFRAEVMRRSGTVEAHVETTYALSAAQTKKLQADLSKAMNADVTLNVSVNKDLLGGMAVTVGSLMIDDSVRRKLERLGRAMATQTNGNQQMKEVG